MKLIKQVPARCKCYDKLDAFRKECQAKWSPGTIVRCDCGIYYTLAEDQRDGRYWRKSYETEVQQALKSTVLPSPTEYTFHEAA